MHLTTHHLLAALAAAPCLALVAGWLIGAACLNRNPVPAPVKRRHRPF